jgi:hypothetical protein
MTISWEDFVKFMDAFAIGALTAFHNQTVDCQFIDEDQAEGFANFCREGGAAMLDYMGVKIVHKEDD